MNDSMARIILVTRSTRLESLVQRMNTIEQARFHVEHLGADFSDYLIEHETYQRAIRQAEKQLAALGRLQRLERSLLANFIFPEDATVVVLGPDGLVANTLKYLNQQAVIGVNPDPSRWDGVLLPFSVQELGSVMQQVLRRERDHRRVSMARVRLSDGQKLLGVNDLFIGPRSHTSARYDLEVGGRRETQSSSGVIVSTGLGSTGWLRSLITGAMGIQPHASDRRLEGLRSHGYAWESNTLHFTVREPFPSRHSEANLVFGTIEQGSEIIITSRMPERGVIFSDGIEADFLDFNSGMTARIGLAERQGRLVQ